MTSTRWPALEFHESQHGCTHGDVYTALTPRVTCRISRVCAAETHTHTHESVWDDVSITMSRCTPEPDHSKSGTAPAEREGNDERYSQTTQQTSRLWQWWTLSRGKYELDWSTGCRGCGEAVWAMPDFHEKYRTYKHWFLN